MTSVISALNHCVKRCLIDRPRRMRIASSSDKTHTTLYFIHDFASQMCNSLLQHCKGHTNRHITASGLFYWHNLYSCIGNTLITELPAKFPRIINCTSWTRQTSTNRMSTENLQENPKIPYKWATDLPWLSAQCLTMFQSDITWAA